MTTWGKQYVIDLFIYLILMNIIGIYSMYSDKSRAKRGQFRISEATLWRIAIIGGAPGMTLGMHWFRHKTRHKAFRVGFPILAIIDILLVLLVVLNAPRVGA